MFSTIIMYCYPEIMPISLLIVPIRRKIMPIFNKIVPNPALIMLIQKNIAKMRFRCSRLGYYSYFVQPTKLDSTTLSLLYACDSGSTLFIF